MIVTKNLSKSYGNNEVLKDINIQLKVGKIYGLLGRNGAGKTTLFRILSNQILNFKGEASVHGKAIKENQDLVEEILLVYKDILPGSLDSDKVKKVFTYARNFFPTWNEDRKDQLILDFDIDTNKKIGKLSDGQKNIVSLIIGLCSGVKVLLFDEPSVGLDAYNRKKFYSKLMEICQEEEKLVVISTHIIDEVENLFEEVLILDQQRILLQDDLSNIQERALVLTGNGRVLDQVLANKNILNKKEIAGMQSVSIFDDLSEEERLYLKNNNIDIKRESLQDLFIYLTDKEA